MNCSIVGVILSKMLVASILMALLLTSKKRSDWKDLLYFLKRFIYVKRLLLKSACVSDGVTSASTTPLNSFPDTSKLVSE